MHEEESSHTGNNPSDEYAAMVVPSGDLVSVFELGVLRLVLADQHKGLGRDELA